MREILFRGKRLDNGEWIEGDLFHCKATTFIHNANAHGRLESTLDWLEEIDPNAVGQDTGLTDKNGKKVFEGDICIDARGFRFVVEWDSDNARFLGRGGDYIRYVGQEPPVEVIGTIHDKEATT